MKNDRDWRFNVLWRAFCDPEKTCLEKLAIAHLLEDELRR